MNPKTPSMPRLQGTLWPEMLVILTVHAVYFSVAFPAARLLSNWNGLHSAIWIVAPLVVCHGGAWLWLALRYFAQRRHEPKAAEPDGCLIIVFGSGCLFFLLLLLGLATLVKWIVG